MNLRIFSTGSSTVDKMVCREWVHASHKRLVKLRLGPEPALNVTDRKGDKLRTVPLDHTDQLTVLESQVINKVHMSNHAK